jgi:hypothetical protein
MPCLLLTGPALDPVHPGQMLIFCPVIYPALSCLMCPVPICIASCPDIPNSEHVHIGNAIPALLLLLPFLLLVLAQALESSYVVGAGLLHFALLYLPCWAMLGRCAVAVLRMCSDTPMLLCNRELHAGMLFWMLQHTAYRLQLATDIQACQPRPCSPWRA